jgi:hypothetical protein
VQAALANLCGLQGPNCSDQYSLTVANWAMSFRKRQLPNNFPKEGQAFFHYELKN